MTSSRSARRLARLAALPAAERERWLETVGDDARLRPTFEALLAGARTGDAGWLPERPSDCPVLDGLLEELSAPRLAVGDTIGSVTLVEVLGEGGMGTVFRGFDTKLERPVAVKAVRAEHRLDPQARARFRREARILSRLRHPSICQVYDLVEGPEADVLLLELVEGRTLGEWLETSSPIEERLPLARALAEALAAAHDGGVIHRDLKPDNVMVTAGGSVKVLDFGIARTLLDGTFEPPTAVAARTVVVPADATAAEDTGRFDPAKATFRTRLGSVLGTIAYMSPEQARGEEVTAASDVYSLGLIFQELFTLRPAYPELPLDELYRRARAGRSEPPSGAGDRLDRLLVAMKSLDPRVRPPAHAVVEVLREVESAPARRRLRRRLAAGALLALGLAAAAAWISGRRAEGSRLLPGVESVRLAVLPATNSTGLADLDWIELGLPEVVGTVLGDYPGIDWIEPARARDAQRAFASDEADEGAEARLARALAADLLVELTVRGAPGELSLEYRTRADAEWSSTRRLTGSEPIGLARAFARRLGARLRPTFEPPSDDARDSDDPELVRLYAMGYDRFYGRGPATARAYFEVCVDRDPDFVLAELQLAAADFKLGRPAEARARAERLAGEAERRGDQRLRAEALNVLGFVAKSGGDFDGAEERFATALALARARGDRAGEARFLHNVGLVRYNRGEDASAREVVDRSLALATEIGDPVQVGWAVNTLGLLALRGQDAPAAIGLFERAVAEGRRGGHREIEALSLNNLAMIAHERRELARARELLTRSLALLESMGISEAVAERRANLGVVTAEEGDLDGAREQYLRALEVFEELGNRNSAAYVHSLLASLEIDRGDLAAARGHLGAARPLFPDEDFTLELTEARLELAAGDPEEALRLVANARRRAGAAWTSENERTAEEIGAAAHAR